MLTEKFRKSTLNWIYIFKVKLKRKKGKLPLNKSYNWS